MMPLVSPSELATQLKAPGTVVLDASWYMPADPRDPEVDYLLAHIPGAQRFDFDGKIKDPNSSLPHMMPTPDAFQVAVRAMGVSAASRLVIYDGAGIFAAPRAWWMFKAMGHNDVAVLNGGLPAWRAENHPIQSGAAITPHEGDFVANPVSRRMASAAQVLAALESNTAIVDARGAPRFEGTVPEPRQGLRSGHMPGARNLPFDQLLQDGKFRSAKDIRALWHTVGLPDSGAVIASCGSGVTASVIALAAESADLPMVTVYDGSWAEWGQDTRPDLPVVKGTA